MQFVICQEAPPGSIFAEDAFDSQIGKLVPVNLKETDHSPESSSIGHARLVGAAILERGQVAKLTLELCPDNNKVAQATADAIFRTDLTSMSFSITE